MEDALFVCRSISILYLWVDLYCVHQKDPVKKAADINAMGQIYSRSRITLAAGITSGLLSASSPDDLGSRQSIEIIGNRKYISALPDLVSQIRNSSWSKRGWTYQEGQMSKRIAFFGKYDVSFSCGAGNWREALHSGKFGHNVHIPDVDLHSRGSHILAASTLPKAWLFRNYSEMLFHYSQRTLSYQSDRLNAISGYLNILGQNGEVYFFAGMPSADFHYALLWYGECDRSREGFPSWSGAGWHTDVQANFILPTSDASGFLAGAGDGIFEYKETIPSFNDVGAEFFRRSHRFNQCSQHLASIRLSVSRPTVTIKSEITRFFLDIVEPDLVEPLPTDPDRHWLLVEAWRDDPLDFGAKSRKTPGQWEPETQYLINDARACFRDSSRNVYSQKDQWQKHWPLFFMVVPNSVRRSTLTWLLRDGVELVKIVEIEFLGQNAGILPFPLILCLGIDRSGCDLGHGRRMGVFCIPKQWWVKAGPKEMEVTFV